MDSSSISITTSLPAAHYTTTSLRVDDQTKLRGADWSRLVLDKA
jgi:hypothetical protein